MDYHFDHLIFLVISAFQCHNRFQEFSATAPSGNSMNHYSISTVVAVGYYGEVGYSNCEQ